MNHEDELRLSFYKEIASVNERHGIKLVQHIDTGKVYVKKTLTHYDATIFEIIRDGHYPGVPVIKELIESDDSLIVIEDYISGHSLDEILEKRTFTVSETIKIISDLCDILLPFHSNNPQIVHRDIKDSNVIIDNEGKVYLIDFDASKMVVEGRNRDTDLIGTEEYAAPEQYGFGQSDQRTDIYALGILINRMLTGKVPSESLCDGALSKLVRKATEIDPGNRYQNVQSLKNALISSSDDEIDSIEVEVVSNNYSDSSETLLKILSRLPYPIRELPGFRSGRLLYFIPAIVWYLLLISFGFFGLSKSSNYTPAENRFYDIATFLLLFIPTLYLGNYLGIRDRAPWKKSGSIPLECIRLIIGTSISTILVVLFVTLVSIILQL